jgi:hypothetical protein
VSVFGLALSLLQSIYFVGIEVFEWMFGREANPGAPHAGEIELDEHGVGGDEDQNQ